MFSNRCRCNIGLGYIITLARLLLETDEQEGRVTRQTHGMERAVCNHAKLEFTHDDVHLRYRLERLQIKS